MSLKICIDDITDKQIDKINEDLQIKIEPSGYINNMNTQTKYIYPFQIIDNYVYLPFSYAVSNSFKRPNKDLFPQSDLEMSDNFKLRPYQKEVNKEVSRILKSGSIIIAAYPAWGKTAYTIYLCVKLKLKTLIIVKGNVLINQWKESIMNFCPNAKIQVLKPKSKLKEDCHFYLMSPINIPKMKPEFFETVGTVVADESHQILAEMLSESLKYLTPRYLIGLSATPYRYDGLNILFDIYFGNEKIVKEFYREHIVYKINTKFVPTVEKTINGTTNWSILLNSQAENTERNELIINIINFFSTRVFLVLCKRVNQAKYLLGRLTEENVYCSSLIESEIDYDTNARVLVSTTNKAGTGFSWKECDALLLAADIQDYYIQILGRVFRREDTIPIVFDLVDENATLKRHFLSRKKVYIKHGGNIEILKKYFFKK